MAYSKTTWADNAAPSIDAEHLNNIEDGVEGIDVRLTSAESSILQISTNTANIGTVSSDVDTIKDNLEDLIIIKRGTFTGTWSPRLDTTFSVLNYSLYNWTVTLNIPTRTTTNGHLLTIEGELNADGVTLNFTATDSATDLTADYTLVGYLKEYSTSSIVNQ